MQDVTIDLEGAEAVRSLAPGRVAGAKRAFTTRRVAPGAMRTLLSGPLKPHPGDLVLARVDELGKHRRIELPDGRRAIIFPGDEIIVCFGNRYAPDQFEAVIGQDLGSCDLVAGGGIAACELSRHDRMSEPTRITPIGLVGDGAGNRLNVRDFALTRPESAKVKSIAAVLSVGTSMNAGKTLAATSMLHGLKAAGFRVAGIKATGTGSGGDLWIMHDAGADLVLDFTDAGFASTYLAPVSALEAATLQLIGHASASGCDVAVIEIADGLQQLETAALIRSNLIRRVVSGVIFSAYDAMGAKFGVDTLQAADHRVVALSGRLAQSPLGMREAERATGLRVYTPWELQAGALVAEVMSGRSRHRATSIPRARTGEACGGWQARSQPLAVVCPEAGHRSSTQAGGGSAAAPSSSHPAQRSTYAEVAAFGLPEAAARVRAIWVRSIRVADGALSRLDGLRALALRTGTDKVWRASRWLQMLVAARRAGLAERRLRAEEKTEGGVSPLGPLGLHGVRWAGHAFKPTSRGTDLHAWRGPDRSGQADGHQTDPDADPDDDVAFGADAAGDGGDGPIHEWALPSRSPRSDYAKAS